jgi:hypothetical protein
MIGVKIITPITRRNVVEARGAKVNKQLKRSGLVTHNEGPTKSPKPSTPAVVKKDDKSLKNLKKFTSISTKK